MRETNWGGNYEYRARKLHRPTTLEQVQEIIAASPGVHVLGSRHSFNDIADSAELIRLDGLPADVVFDHSRGTVSCGAALRYGDLAEAMKAEGVALHNLASLPHISVAGAVMTATHGSGAGNANLATAVTGLEVVTPSGEILTTARGDTDFDGLVVGLGAIGAVTRVTLDVEPAFDVRQRVFEGLGWDALFEHLDEISALGHSVSLFTRWGADAGQVWVKSRATDAPEEVRGEVFGAVAATVDRHPVPGLDAINCTPQLGRRGLWSDRLPHFRMGFKPSSGEELQSEYHVARRHGVGATEALRALGDRMRPLLQVAEIRWVAADRLWMSPQHGQDTVGFHFTWLPEQPAVEEVLVDLEAALAPFDARPHWGKVFMADTAAIAPLYPRRPDFIRLQERLDPRGAFRNRWLEKHVLGDR
ncbi:MAG: FAD-binding protein [Candidatus Nephthysia bennettiae]|uniref:FAD-binding protein n=1 Tax=Candidatus Nephthysia bennettiae TaxID=3127016 RepID=A0A934KDD8_9BACT|nr:FAD-binding protein [Candidatus Dormibacteraeota bacterium]MBJ7612957.1 FAD-binding protein [Candidatus Dormibacteraeota bacterium]PZR86948.1 MAG: FAD-binding protein [Candidatus Dormibacteraeota bacterium]